MSTSELPKSILVIDDEPDICEVIQVALGEFAGWQVTTAGSGKEGLEILDRLSFDLILLDISMPEMDGISVFEQMRSHPTAKDIPVILLTAKVLASDQERFAKIGVVGVIGKPFNPIDLSTKIAKLMEWN
ncbi:MAG: response regulator [Pseudanabaenaceae cyanobacterium]